MSTAGPLTPPPGWYPDPGDPSRARWWTGTEWAPPAARRPNLVATFDLAQRIVLVIGFGLVLFVFGRWVTHIGSHGLAAYRPMVLLRAGAGGLHPWAKFVIWLVLVAGWTAASIWLLRQPREVEGKEP